jgi:hypothetical protein
MTTTLEMLKDFECEEARMDQKDQDLLDMLADDLFTLK